MKNFIKNEFQNRGEQLCTIQSLYVKISIEIIGIAINRNMLKNIRQKLMCYLYKEKKLKNSNHIY